ncbi:MAG: hypothetical protein AB1420_12345 [Bacillota bacterium]
MKKFLAANAWWIIFITSALLLIMHTFSLAIIQVDNTSLLLLVILLVSPFISGLKKIKIGDFEAEIDPKEIKKVKDEMSIRFVAGKNGEDIKTSPRLQDTIDNLQALVVTDHIFALAKLKIELEKILTKISHMATGENSKSKNKTLGKLIQELVCMDILPKDVSKSLKEVLHLCNRAIHGQEVRINDARSIVDIGISLLIHINEILEDYLIKPEEIVEITHEELSNLQNANYKVVTIAPNANTFLKNIRLVSHEELAQILEGYDDYAESIVEIKRI